LVIDDDGNDGPTVFCLGDRVGDDHEFTEVRGAGFAFGQTRCGNALTSRIEFVGDVVG